MDHKEVCKLISTVSILSSFWADDINAHFTLQVIHQQDLDYAEIEFRSVVDHTRFLVFTPQGIRLEVPSGGNHVFRSNTIGG